MEFREEPSGPTKASGRRFSRLREDIRAEIEIARLHGGCFEPAYQFAIRNKRFRFGDRGLVNFPGAGRL
jgi:hypothetical protein